MKNQKGFSLVELLVVVIIIAIIAAIAIPSLLASRRAANEASAVQSLRTIHSAESTFQALSTTRVYGVLSTLSTAPNNLLDPTFTTADFSKSGYTFSSSITADGSGFCAAGAPQTGQGTRFFGVDGRGVIYAGPAAADVACATGALTTTAAATAIQ